MANGSKYWADSYIVLKDGRKFYLEDDVSTLERKLKSDKKRIKVEIASLLSDSTISIKKKDISFYGEV